MTGQTLNPFPQEELQDSRDFWFACVDVCVIRDRTLSVNAKVVYSVLTTYANTGGKRACFPKIETIARDANLSQRSVKYALKDLRERGYIECRQRRSTGGNQQSSIYTLIGHRAKPQGAESALCRVQDLQGQGAYFAPEELEPLEPKRLSPSESTSCSGGTKSSEAEPNAEAETQEPVQDHVDLQEVPSAFRETVELFCFKTGRTALSREDLDHVRALEEIHTPARVQAEITRILKRFDGKGKPASDLSWRYLRQALQHQRSLKPQNPTPQPTRDPDDFSQEIAEGWDIR